MHPSFVTWVGKSSNMAGFEGFSSALFEQTSSREERWFRIQYAGTWRHAGPFSKWLGGPTHNSFYQSVGQQKALGWRKEVVFLSTHPFGLVIITVLRMLYIATGLHFFLTFPLFIHTWKSVPRFMFLIPKIKLSHCNWKTIKLNMMCTTSINTVTDVYYGIASDTSVWLELSSQEGMRMNEVSSSGGVAPLMCHTNSFPS